MLALFKTMAFLFGHLPLTLSFLLGRALGALAFRADKRRRQIGIDNIGRAIKGLKPGEAEAVVRGVFIHLATAFFEFMRIPWMKREEMKRRIDCVGLENLDKALSRKKGVIILTGHLGNWEYLAAFMGLSGYPINIVVRDPDYQPFNEFVRWVRRRCGNTTLVKRGAMRKLLKGLSDNGIIFLMTDQNVARDEGVFVDFFGIPACTNKGPALLAAASGASVIPACSYRDGKRYRLEFHEEVELVNTGDKEKDAGENTARFAKTIEEMIRRHPDEWLWFHRRWKTRPLPGNIRADLAVEISKDSDRI